MLAKGQGADVFNALEIMDCTKADLEALKFEPGVGSLHYYLFNWRCAAMTGRQVAIVLP